MKREQKCIAGKWAGEECCKTAQSRGLCSRHYELLRTRVAKGNLTWEHAVKSGMCEKRLEHVTRQLKTASIFKPELNPKSEY